MTNGNTVVLVIAVVAVIVLLLIIGLIVWAVRRGKAEPAGQHAAVPHDRGSAEGGADRVAAAAVPAPPHLPDRDVAHDAPAELMQTEKVEPVAVDDPADEIPGPPAPPQVPEVIDAVDAPVVEWVEARGDVVENSPETEVVGEPGTAAEVPESEVEEEPVPAEVEAPESEVVEEVAPAEGDAPEPAEVEAPEPVVDEEPVPAEVEAPEPVVDEEPVPAEVEEPVAAEVEEPEPSDDAIEAGAVTEVVEAEAIAPIAEPEAGEDPSEDVAESAAESRPVTPVPAWSAAIPLGDPEPVVVESARAAQERDDETVWDAEGAARDELVERDDDGDGVPDVLQDEDDAAAAEPTPEQGESPLVERHTAPAYRPAWTPTTRPPEPPAATDLETPEPQDAPEPPTATDLETPEPQDAPEQEINAEAEEVSEEPQIVDEDPAPDALEVADDVTPDTAEVAAPEAEEPSDEDSEESPEVRDGGYGWGSAAPTSDGRQPKGHPVKGHEEWKQYHEPGSQWYDQTTVDVWFTDAEAAERAGFHRA